ncbi:PLP-dependent aminotransferase family protein [Sphingomonas sp. NFR15]|uniref:aminotransferase-like domain-containing protein n=1 Tax=Sphingomonas sp. NFR15 TaxID=1566282 RepID=UPI000B8A2852|nr:PLP-dependent aminotransferase family protein [Sphingomonas sp. NFR15]
MQSWMPDIAAVPGPKYLAIAEALARDIQAGSLTGGMRLPPQRSLAEALGVDLTTVTRAYGEVRRLGLIEGDGRRGSFVRQTAADAAKTGHGEPGDTGMNAPPEIAGGRMAAAFRHSVETLSGRPDGAALFQYQPSGGMVAARKAGADLLNARGIPCHEDTVVVTAGGQHALHAIVSAALQPADAVAVGSFVYPGFQAVARRYGLRLAIIASDAEGLIPEALDVACAQGDVRAIYVVPTNDNPTTATMRVERRQALAAIAERHGLTIIEDDAYGLLRERPLPPIASFAPDRTWHIASVSKILSPGLRVAWLRAPAVAQAWRLAGELHETAIMAPPLNAAVVVDWIGTGVFEQLIGAVRGEARTRLSLAAEFLDPDSFHCQPEGYHIWMRLHADANPGEIVNALRPHGLSVVGGEAFAVDRATAPPALRVSIGGTISRDRLERGLRLLGALTAPGATGKISLV